MFQINLTASNTLGSVEIERNISVQVGVDRVHIEAPEFWAENSSVPFTLEDHTGICYSTQLYNVVDSKLRS